MIVQGVDSVGISRPLLLAADGSVIVSATNLTTTGGKILIDASGRVADDIHGWINGAWQKLPMLSGYSGLWTEDKSNLNAAAGSNLLTGSNVPAGEIWRVQNVSALNVNTAMTRILLYCVVGGVNIILQDAAPAIAGRYNVWSGEIILAPGDHVEGAYVGCAAGDDIYLRYYAVRVDIDQ